MLGNPSPEFQPEVMPDIYEWAEFEASQMIFIYSEQDISPEELTRYLMMKVETTKYI